MSDKIEKGDIVSVQFNSLQYTLCSNGIVEYVPTGPGDYWIIKDLEYNRVYHISVYEACTISKKIDISEQYHNLARSYLIRGSLPDID